MPPTPVPGPGRCHRCFLQTAVCLCPGIPLIDTRTHVVVVRHWLEAAKPSNTGRIAALALRRAAVHDYARPAAPLDVGALVTPGTWLLYPEPGAPQGLAGRPPPVRLVVLDATWAQARRMRQRIAALRGLPRLALPAPTRPRERLRTPSHPDAMATLEAIAAALALLEDPGIGAALDALYARMVVHSKATARSFHGSNCGGFSTR